MKRILICVITAVLCSMHPALGQSYPSRPIRLIVPFAPGGGSDLIARIAAQKLTEAMGQQVLVDNRPGAGGTVGAELGVKVPADGYTLTLIAASYTVGPSMYKLTFDAAAGQKWPVARSRQGIEVWGRVVKKLRLKAD